jgi:hypothetical protein
MKPALPPVSPRVLVWFGVLGAPAAWTAQHISGFALTEASCQEVAQTWDVALETWTIAVTAGAAAVGVLAWLAAIATWRATRDAGDDPPPSRIHFLSIMGMTLTPLFLMIILMSGLGAILLPECVQS